MCLELKSNKEKFKIAKKDIICYKRLEFFPTIDMHSVKDGDEFNGVINKFKCSGKISIESDKVYFCTNHPLLCGTVARNKYGYTHSWVLDNTVTSIIINNIEVIDLKMVTPYRNFPVEIGKTYESNLIKKDEYVHEGLHSFKNLDDAKKYHNGICVKCIIPKGSEYYEGTFCDMDSYASNELTYVKIIKDCSNK